MPEMSSLIDRVTLSDLYRVANRVLRPQSSPVLSDRKKNGKVTVVAQGKIAGGRLGDDVEEALRRRGIGAQ